MKLALLLLAACVPQAGEGKPPAWVADTSIYGGHAATAEPSLADRYREVAAKILNAARADRGAYKLLAELTDGIGHRFSGSPELDRAIAWAVGKLQAEGLDAHTEKVMIPHWVRGAEDAAITAPIARPLHLIGLGGTVATPKGGVTAPVLVVHDWKELEAAADRCKGAIVLYDVPMITDEQKGPGYGETVQYRTNGASRAAQCGAVAALVRSVTSHSLATPHTGAMHYDDKVATKIPTAAVTVEDATLLARLAARGPVTVHLHLESQQLPDVESANVIGELRGREKPDEIVVIGGHLDSWDVGQGAHDDGAGVVTMIEALHVLKQLGLQPRRTIRVVLFTNEENGLRGGKAYAEQHAAELPKTVLALESDSGGFSPRGFVVGAQNPDAATRMVARLTDLASLLSPLGATKVIPETHGGGADISPMAPAGVPQVGLLVDWRTYFDYHHTDADTLDKVDPAQLADDVAAVAVLAYLVADLPGRVTD